MDEKAKIERYLRKKLNIYDYEVCIYFYNDFVRVSILGEGQWPWVDTKLYTYAYILDELKKEELVGKIND